MAVSVGDIEAILRLRDELSTKVAAAARTTQEAATAIGQATDKIEGDVAQAGDTFEAFGQTITGVSQKSKDSLKQLEDELRKTKDAIAGSQGKVDAFKQAQDAAKGSTDNFAIAVNKLGQYVGGYEDWLRQRVTEEQAATPQRAGTPTADAKRGNNNRRLSYKEQRELEALPGKIESLEAEQAELHAVLSNPAFYQPPHDKIAVTMERLKGVTDELEACYARWQSLETQSNATDP